MEEDIMSKGIIFKNASNEKIYPCPYYPIGSIYISVNNTNPTTYFGGTWEQIKDKFLLCAGDSYTAGSTGGNKTHYHSTESHTLTINEIPSHGHTLYYSTASSGYASGIVIASRSSASNTRQYNGSYSFEVYTQSSGGGGDRKSVV